MLSVLEEALRSWLTPIIAGIALWIAYSQYKNTKSKIKLELFDRRIGIYENTRSLLGKITRDAIISNEDLLQFRRDCTHAKFLFGPEVVKELDDIFDKGLILITTRDQIKHEVGEHRTTAISKHHDALKWLVERFDDVDEIMRPYLDFRNIRT